MSPVSGSRRISAMDDWRPIETAPKDGTWILGMNNRGNPAVIIWDDNALDFRGERRAGWIHPFSDGQLSSFWNGACGSEPEYWMPIPWHPKQRQAPDWSRSREGLPP